MCAYLDGEKAPMQQLYFCPKIIPPPKDNNEMKGLDKDSKYVGWLELKRQLCLAAPNTNNSIVSTSGNNSTRRCICAHHYRMRKPRVMVSPPENQFCETLMIYNRKNNRPDGQYRPSSGHLLATMQIRCKST